VHGQVVVRLDAQNGHGLIAGVWMRREMMFISVDIVDHHRRPTSTTRTTTTTDRIVEGGVGGEDGHGHGFTTTSLHLPPRRRSMTLRQVVVLLDAAPSSFLLPVLYQVHVWNMGYLFGKFMCLSCQSRYSSCKF
jgi:hypothetical protein